MFNLYRIILLLISFLLLATSCDFSRKHEDEILITVGEKGISRKEVLRKIEHIISDMGITDQDARTGLKSILNRIVENEMILAYGRKNGITVSEDELESEVQAVKRSYPGDAFNEMLLKEYIDVNEWKKNIRETLLIKKIVETVVGNSIGVTFEEAKEYYEEHQEDFFHPRMLEIRQIVTKTRDDMNRVQDLLNNGSSMADLAKEYSIAPEAEAGGILGWVAEGQLNKVIDEFIFSLKEGTPSKILESPYGFHIFEVLSVREQGVRTFPESIKEIEARISMGKREIEYKKWLNSLKKEFPVNVKEQQILADMDMEE